MSIFLFLFFINNKIYIKIKIIGSGKTTILNFLSGRLTAQNLSISGKLYMNG